MSPAGADPAKPGPKDELPLVIGRTVPDPKAPADAKAPDPKAAARPPTAAPPAAPTAAGPPAAAAPPPEPPRRPQAAGAGGRGRSRAARRRAAREHAARSTWTVVVWLLFAFFILGPLVTVLAFSFTPSVFEGIRPTTLHWYQRLFESPDQYFPLIRSFQVASIVVAIQLVLGTMVAYGTARGRVYGSQLLDAMSNLTIALPSVVVGLALLSFYGAYGPVRLLSELLFDKPFTFTWTLWIVVFAHVLETFPYMVRTVGTALAHLPPNLESAARSLGAGRLTVFRTVVLPMLKPSLLAGGVLVFSRSIAEFGATIVVVSAVLRTAPIRIYAEAEAGALEMAAAYSVVLMLVSFGIYLVLRQKVLKRSGALVD